LATLRDIGLLAKAAYFDTITLFRERWPALLAIGLMVLGGAIAGSQLGRLVGTGIGRSVLSTLASIVALYFTAPLLVALTRSLVDGEPIYARDVRGSDLANLYFAWGGLLAFAMLVPELAFVIAGTSVLAASPEGTASGMLALLRLVAAVVVWIIAIRTATLLPGVAIEGRDMTLDRALRATRGRFWFVTGVFVVIALAPVLILAVVLGLAAGAAGDAAATVFPWVYLLAAVILLPLAATVGLVASVRLYQQLGTQRPPARW
jgi:hypothetical protein